MDFDINETKVNDWHTNYTNIDSKVASRISLGQIMVENADISWMARITGMLFYIDSRSP